MIPFNPHSAVEQWQWHDYILLLFFKELSFDFLYGGKSSILLFFEKEECWEICSTHPIKTNIGAVSTPTAKISLWHSHISINLTLPTNLQRLANIHPISQELFQDLKKPREPSTPLLSILKIREMSTNLLSDRLKLSIQMFSKNSREAFTMKRKTLLLFILATNHRLAQIISWELLHLKRIMWCWETC